MARTGPKTRVAIRVGDIQGIPLGQGRCYVVEDREIAVFRQRDGRLFAAQNRCPHRQGPLADGLVGGGTVICPLHAHRFDLATGSGSEPAECLSIYGVEVVNGQALLDADSLA